MVNAASSSPGRMARKSKTSSEKLKNGDKETAHAQQRIGQMFSAQSAAAAHKRLQAAANGDHQESDNDDDDSDRGEGTSADRASIMAKLASASAAGHITIASLLKEPLLFVQAKHADEASKKLPYEPLAAATVASTPQTNGKGKGPTLANGTHDDDEDDDKTIVNSSSKPNSSSMNSFATTASTAASSVHTLPLPASWPQAYPPGPGYHNLGNTCFLNSVLQSLTHTAPLVACLMGDSYHSVRTCKLTANSKFCLLCAMQRHIRACFSKGRPGAMAPSNIVNKLSAFAKGMRVGRQEDAHEFLRFFLDGLQQSAAVNMTPPAKTELQKENTFLSRIFGGKLRSRVSCSNCKSNSDTFDSFMDLSLDVATASSVKEAFQAFIKVDLLQGANKYKCEKCKKLVAARKQFTINKAPQILHIHLKRFTPTGRKIVGHISYPEQLSLAPYMSEETEDKPTYRLYAVVCHSGHGPHSGHYFANVRAGNGKWTVMNDSSTHEVPASGACNQRNAYLLFYERTNRLSDAVGRSKLPSSLPNGVGQTMNSTSSTGKRKERDADDDDESNTSQAFPQQRIKMNGQSNGTKLKSSPVSSPSSHPETWTGFTQPQTKGDRTPPASPSRKTSSVPSFGPRPASVLQQQQQQRKNGSAYPPLAAKAFFGGKDRHRNRPKMVSNMVGRPR